MLKQAWCNKQDLITQPGNCNDSHRSVCKHLQKDEGECKYRDSSVIQQHKGTHTCAHTADFQQNGQTEYPLNQIYAEITPITIQFPVAERLPKAQAGHWWIRGTVSHILLFSAFHLGIYRNTHVCAIMRNKRWRKKGCKKKRRPKSLFESDSWTTIVRHRRCLQTGHQQNL